MCVRFLNRFFLVFLFVLSSLQHGSAAQPGDLVSMSYLGRYSISALEVLNDELLPVGCIGIPDTGRARRRCSIRGGCLQGRVTTRPTSITLSSSGLVFTRILLRVDLRTLSFTPMERR